MYKHISKFQKCQRKNSEELQPNSPLWEVVGEEGEEGEESVA